VVVESAIEGATVGAAVARKAEKSCFDSDHSARMAPEKCKPWLEPHSARMAPEKIVAVARSYAAASVRELVRQGADRR
jgi:hypothetical protein